ncbi:uncharacterized protein LOC127834094 isoform X2 [Dreissena polymorpha]|uniref:uncharacterized protein LOC127834094 isoform X2 n=1 Tax=Dreissena polymorpha TaxID=45954 RepID=UPI0022642E1E|nr:uncharacterized protein LOC127834094 isoform X2 [Dreissena polymorpha]
MTNRTYVRPYSAGTEIKRPRLKRVEVCFDEAPPPSPVVALHNGIRPHGGYRGAKPLPPGQFSFNKDEHYQQDVEEAYSILVNNENFESHGAPYWVSDVQREVTHSGESPLFTNKLFPTGKFEQEHGVINFERALLSSASSRRRPTAAPRRRHLNGRREFYRPNSTHQYLSATDLRNMNENEEILGKYGRPTRTTLLRARQRTHSAPVNAYDLRRENNKRAEEIRNNSLFQTSKEYINIFATDGETMHSFLTGARYNRAHLLDSKGLTVYGVYMPRENPTECFITGQRRMRDVGDEIPSAPPDSPRSDTDEPTSPVISRPASSKHANQVRANHTSSRPGSNRPTTKQSSRPPSNRKLRGGSSTRPKSETGSTRSLPQRPSESPKRELPVPSEVTLEMPDHINKGKGGVYVTLRGQKLMESIDSKLPRVTGISLPKISHKSRDHVDEFMLMNQPPPTPVDASLAGGESRGKQDLSSTATRTVPQIDENVKDEAEEMEKTPQRSSKDNDVVHSGHENMEDEHDNVDVIKIKSEDKPKVISQTIIVENKLTDRKSMEIGPVKKVNFSDLQMPTESNDVLANDDSQRNRSAVDDADNKDSDKKNEVNAENVVFFVTEKDVGNEENEDVSHSDNGKSFEDVKHTESNTEDYSENNEPTEDNSGDDRLNAVEDVIKVEISELAKEGHNGSVKDEDDIEEELPVTSEDYPFASSN